jgi:peptidyl-Lys metalloendopeptidase
MFKHILHFLLALLPLASLGNAQAVRGLRQYFTKPKEAPQAIPDDKLLADRRQAFFSASGQSSMMTFELTTKSEALICISATGPVNFSSYYTPFYGEKFDQVEDMFHVTPSAKFIGATAAYAYNFDKTAIRLSNGKSMSMTFDLSRLYALEPGTSYSVQYSHTVYSLDDKDWLPVTSNQVNVTITDKTRSWHNQDLATRWRPSGVGTNIFKKRTTRSSNVNAYSCNVTDINTINPALSAARTKSTIARSCFDKGTSTLNRFSRLVVKWFGQDAWYSSLYYTLDNKASWVQYGLNGEDFGVQCRPSACRSDWFAFVNPADTNHTINLCDVFFTAVMREQINTFAHEMSHFHDIASTLDITYGPSSCLSLALSNPSSAVDNADSFGYFVAQMNPHMC